MLAGGVGAARFLRGLVEVVDPADVTAVVNTADDFTLHGLRICPDIDTVRYTLSNDVGPEGWGRRDETWRAMDELSVLATQAPSGSLASAWFRLGDRDIAIHLYRTQRLAEGATLSEVTRELQLAADLQTTILPVTDDCIATKLTVDQKSGSSENVQEIDFQEYFVARRHQVPISSVRFDGIDGASPAPDVIDSILEADRIVIAPSNPIVSIGPLLAVPGVADAVRSRRGRVVAVSPIVGGKALKGPADRLLVELGHESSVIGVAKLWSPFASTLVVDEEDRSDAAAIEATETGCVVTNTVMSDLEASARLATTVLAS